MKPNLSKYNKFVNGGFSFSVASGRGRAKKGQVGKDYEGDTDLATKKRLFRDKD